MKRSLLTLLLALGFSSAFAQDWQNEARLAITAEDGTVVGVGEVDELNLELELLEGYSGFAQLSSTDDEGNVTTYEVMISADGTITLVSADGFANLAEMITESGGNVEVSFEDDANEFTEEAEGVAEEEDEAELDDESQEHRKDKDNKSEEHRKDGEHRKDSSDDEAEDEGEAEDEDLDEGDDEDEQEDSKEDSEDEEESEDESEDLDDEDEEDEQDDEGDDGDEAGEDDDE